MSVPSGSRRATAEAAAAASGLAPSPPALARFDEGGLVFWYPASWREFHYQVPSTMSTLIAYLATVDVPEPCTRSANEIACSERYHLVPGSLVVTVQENGWPDFDMLDHRPADATALTVGGLPAYVETTTSDASHVGAERTVTWTLSRPGSVDNYYTIQVQLAGPDVAVVRAQLDALIASVRYDPPVVPLPSGAAAQAAAVALALGTLSKDSATWRCFPTQAGSRQMIVDALTNGPPSPPRSSPPARPRSRAPRCNSGASRSPSDSTMPIRTPVAVSPRWCG